jgi:transposase
VIGSTRAVQVWARRVPTDLRNGYNGLYGIVKREFDRDPLSGDAFLFVNKRRKSAKVLLWDGTGLCIYSKRLSRGVFSDVWAEKEGQQLRMTTAELATETNRGRQQSLALELKILQERINQRNRELFGSKSEKRGRPQASEEGDGSGEEEGDGSEEVKPEPKPKKRNGAGSKRTKQPELPIAKVRHLLDEADQVCPQCGGKLYAKGDKCERSERIVVTERVYTLVTDEKQMYGCGHCGHAETALAPPQLVPGGRYGNSIAINVAVDKYVDHQPLNRQVSAMRRAGLRVSRQALWNQLNALAKLCEPSYEATPGCCASTRCCTPTRRPSA